MREAQPDTPAGAALVTALARRSIVLVGMMGAGKSSVGKRLKARLGIEFVDSDDEIASQCGMSISEYFEKYSEEDFRRGEARVIAKLLDRGCQIISTGGGAFCNADTQAAIRAKGLSIWLKDDVEVLLPRVLARNDMPMLKGDDPAAAFRRLFDERQSYYAAADITIELKNRQRDKIVQEIIDKSEIIIGILNARRVGD